ncbi:rod shape-determining protein MreC [Massilibacterium senegalense]|uniref:rod shape-determining protein MreC n=1 Tax=Massilibacterium senegalense TaxID=1632858 RepID=UPI0007855FF6|nr:rod shape-determining protein MreC [Massilibacterium senegalense]
MPQFFSNKKLILLLASIILLVALIGLSMRDRDKLTWPEQLMKDSVGWVQSIFTKPADYVAGFFENVRDINRVYEENKRLKKQLDEYASLSVKVSELTLENEDLREQANIDETLREYKVRNALVIARSPEEWHQFLTIDKGQKDGIEKNMAVITNKGLIGKVKDVSQFSSTVQLISDIDRANRISAVVEGNDRAFGLIEGYQTEKKAIVMTKIPSDVEIKKGQIVATSGLGGTFPRGLVIGKIKKVTPDDYGLTQTALIEPAADLYDVDHVMVTERIAQTIGNEPEQVEEE